MSRPFLSCAECGFEELGFWGTPFIYSITLLQKLRLIMVYNRVCVTVMLLSSCFSKFLKATPINKDYTLPNHFPPSQRTRTLPLSPPLSIQHRSKHLQ